VAEIQGTCDERFESVREALAASLDAGTDLGASVAVSFQGELVVDIWGGWQDEAQQIPWVADTITNVWSTTKTMTNLCALFLADQGEVALDAPVAKYWPEFAAGGKDAVEVRHLLAHTAGLSGWTEHITVEDLYDWEKATSLLAAQEPWWEPGTRSGYHAVTQGFLVGEVVRRVTGQSLGTFFAEQLAGPLHADFHIGLPDSEHHRVSRVVPPPPPDPDAVTAELAVRTLTNPRLAADASWESAWRRAEIPAANGHGNARSVVAVQSAVAGGGEVAGVRVLSPAGCQAIFAEQSYSDDLVLGVPMRLGVGYGLVSPDAPLSENPRTCYWGGWGGSIVVNDLDAQLCVAYMMNKMGSALVGDMRGANIVFAANQAAAAT
jgi:CubicO group peptidase (beta-lactamase class C family)